MKGFLGKVKKIKRVNEEKQYSLAESKATAIQNQKQLSELLKYTKEIE